MIKKHKKLCRVWNNSEHLLTYFNFRSYWMRFCFCFCFFSWCSLCIYLAVITSFAIGLKICVITAGMKKYKSIIKKNNKKMLIK